MDLVPTKLTAPLLAALVSLAPLPVIAAAPDDGPAGDEQTDEERGKQLFENGRRLFDEGAYEPAIEAFLRAYKLLDSPNLLFNIHLAYERLENYDKAIEYLDKYRAVATAEEQDDLSRRRESLETRRQRAKTAPTDEPPPTTTMPEETPPEPTPAEPTDKPPPKDIKVFGPGAIAATVVAVVAAGVGIGLGVGANNRKNRAEDACSGTLCQQTFDDDAQSSRNLAIGANVSFGIAGVAAVVAITLIAVNASRKRKANATAQRFQLGPMGVSARF